MNQRVVDSQSGVGRYRPNVAALIRCQGKFLSCLRKDGFAWQCVQGGYEASDGTPEAALLRELVEELGAPAQAFTLVRRSAAWRRYDFPPELLRKKPKGDYIGQEQLWFEVELDSLSSLNLAQSCQEFSDVKLSSVQEIIESYPEWKKTPLLEFCRELGLV